MLANMGGFLYDVAPGFSGFVMSVLCLLFWAVIGLYTGYKNDRRYIIGASLVWLGEIAFYSIGFVLLNGKVTGFITIAIYGLRHIIPFLNGNWKTIILSLTAYLVAVLSFGIGYMIRKRKRNL